MKLNIIAIAVGVLCMILAACSVFNIAPVVEVGVVNETVTECIVNVTPVVEPTPPWGYACMDCHRNPHLPMEGVPSDKEFNGHKNLDCSFCHADYESAQQCISCHAGHKILSSR